MAEVRQAHEGHVLGALLIGSVTKERSPASDLDVSVVFDDHYYEAKSDRLRRELSALAERLNREVPGPELVLWASKDDHFKTLFPDVSYVRANLPASDERLDAWCGLAKHVLRHYEVATAQQLWGEPDARIWWKIPRGEAVELFLLATRTFAEGLAEVQSDNPDVRRSGHNHVAKALLRGVYAHLLTKDGQARNSYADIHRDAYGSIPDRCERIIEAAYQAKTQSTPLLDEESIDELLQLLRFCELSVAAGPRWRMAGGADKPGDAGFMYEPDTLDEDRPVQDYRRCPDAQDNYVQFGYFLITAPIVLQRLAQVPAQAGLADFYFEELAAVTTYALKSSGLAIRYGQRDEGIVYRPIDADLVRSIAQQLEVLADAYLGPGADSRFERPWLDVDRKLQRTAALLLVLDSNPHVSVSVPLLERLQSLVGSDSLLDGTEWICELAAKAFSVSGLKLLTETGLSLYKNGDVPRAERVLGRAAELAHEEVQLGGLQQRELDELRSRALQYHGIALRRAGDPEGARQRLLVALDRDPENFSALDDLASLLAEHAECAEARSILLPRLARVEHHSAEAREQIGMRAMNRAIDLKQADQLDEAEEWYGLTLEVDPDLPSAYFNYGLLLEEIGRVEDALAAYITALDKDPSYAKALERLAYWRAMLDPDG